MARKKPGIDPAKRAEILAEVERLRAGRATSYRDRALALFPHVCGRCGREFSGKTLRELTVHHKDHNHNNNPPDGSNWELLCLYCHDDEHQDSHQRESSNATPLSINPETALGFEAFANLKNLLNTDKDQEPQDQNAKDK